MHRLKADYPDTAKMLKIMQDEELVHAQRLMETCRAQFGEHIPFIQRQDVKGFVRRKPLWLAKVLSIQQVRKEVEVIEAESMRFYQTAAKRATNLSARKLLDELAVAEQAHEDLAGKLKTELEESGARKAEDQTHRRMFVLQVIQPGLAGLMGICFDAGSRLRGGLCHAGPFGTPSWSAWRLPSAPALAWALPKPFPTMVCSVGADILSFGGWFAGS